MYYHLRLDYIDPKVKANQTLFAYDIYGLDIVMDNYVIPYLSSKEIIFSGAKVSCKDIRRLQVYCTENDIKASTKIANDNLNPNIIFVYTRQTVLDNDDVVSNVTEEVMKSAREVIDAKPKQQEINQKVNKDSKRIFIVHGHDKAIRTETEMMVKDLGYDPIVLFKQPDGGATIIEKLEKETKDVAFAIVLYTNCDKGCAKESNDLQPRARQNVVFEHGLLCGILGRNRVVALCEDGVEIPGDLSGVVYKKIDEAGNWKFQIAKEMKAAGLPIDLNNLL